MPSHPDGNDAHCICDSLMRAYLTVLEELPAKEAKALIRRKLKGISAFDINRLTTVESVIDFFSPDSIITPTQKNQILRAAELIRLQG